MWTRFLCTLSIIHNIMFMIENCFFFHIKACTCILPVSEKYWYQKSTDALPSPIPKKQKHNNNNNNNNNINCIYIFSYLIFYQKKTFLNPSSKNKKDPSRENFLYFRKRKPQNIYFIFSKESRSNISGKKSL